LTYSLIGKHTFERINMQHWYRNKQMQMVKKQGHAQSNTGKWQLARHSKIKATMLSLIAKLS